MTRPSSVSARLLEKIAPRRPHARTPSHTRRATSCFLLRENIPCILTSSLPVARALQEDGWWGWLLALTLRQMRQTRHVRESLDSQTSLSFTGTPALLFSLWPRVPCSTWGIANGWSSDGCRLYFTDVAPGRQVNDEPWGGMSPKCRATLWRRSRRCTNTCCFSTSVICKWVYQVNTGFSRRGSSRFPVACGVGRGVAAPPRVVC